jgi:hypothetical protein
VRVTGTASASSKEPFCLAAMAARHSSLRMSCGAGHPRLMTLSSASCKSSNPTAASAPSPEAADAVSQTSFRRTSTWSIIFHPWAGETPSTVTPPGAGSVIGCRRSSGRTRIRVRSLFPSWSLKMRTIPSTPRSTYRRRSIPLVCDTPYIFMKPIPFVLSQHPLRHITQATYAGTGHDWLYRP